MGQRHDRPEVKTPIPLPLPRVSPLLRSGIARGLQHAILQKDLLLDLGAKLLVGDPLTAPDPKDLADLLAEQETLRKTMGGQERDVTPTPPPPKARRAK